MKRLRYLFAAFLLLLAMPMWRFIDLAVIASPWAWIVNMLLTSWFGIFVLIPAKLLFPKFRTIFIPFALGIFMASAYFIRPLSKMSTTNPEFNHCGPLTWTGVFYPMRGVLSEAHMDDLEARNQLCWMRKMIGRIPDKLESAAELAQYMKITRDKLLRPQIKFRVTLPLITIFQMKILANYESNEAIPSLTEGKLFLEGITFWQDQYTTLISERKYGPGSWPHSEWIRFEYGLMENHWDGIIESIR